VRKTLLSAFAVVCLLLCSTTRSPAEDGRPADQERKAGAVRFSWINVYIDSGTRPLAAYQVELVAERGRVTIVSVEGGEHKAFRDPPYYDPAALKNHRVILAAFNTAKELPTGRTRVARVHVRQTGIQALEYAARLQVAASADGKKIDASVTLELGEKK